LIILEPVQGEPRSQGGRVKPTEAWAATSDLGPEAGPKPEVENCDDHPEGEDVANYEHDEHEVGMDWKLQIAVDDLGEVLEELMCPPESDREVGEVDKSEDEIGPMSPVTYEEAEDKTQID
jgi:hypothetical protein